jgi:hypothetical protein
MSAVLQQLQKSRRAGRLKGANSTLSTDSLPHDCSPRRWPSPRCCAAAAVATNPDASPACGASVLIQPQRGHRYIRSSCMRSFAARACGHVRRSFGSIAYACCRRCSAALWDRRASRAYQHNPSQAEEVAGPASPGRPSWLIGPAGSFNRYTCFALPPSLRAFPWRCKGSSWLDRTRLGPFFIACYTRLAPLSRCPQAKDGRCSASAAGPVAGANFKFNGGGDAAEGLP